MNLMDLSKHNFSNLLHDTCLDENTWMTIPNGKVT